MKELDIIRGKGRVGDAATRERIIAKTALCTGLYAAGCGIMAALMSGAITGSLAVFLAPLVPALIFAGLFAHITANMENRDGTGFSSFRDCAKAAAIAGAVAYGLASWIFEPHLKPPSIYSASLPMGFNAA